MSETPWICPQCGSIQSKSGARKIYEDMIISGTKLYGTERCTRCRKNTPQQEIYSGMHDEPQQDSPVEDHDPVPVVAPEPQISAPEPPVIAPQPFVEEETLDRWEPIAPQIPEEAHASVTARSADSPAARSSRVNRLELDSLPPKNASVSSRYDLAPEALKPFLPQNPGDAAIVDCLSHEKIRITMELEAIGARGHGLTTALKWGLACLALLFILGIATLGFSPMIVLIVIMAVLLAIALVSTNTSLQHKAKTESLEFLLSHLKRHGAPARKRDIARVLENYGHLLMENENDFMLFLLLFPVVEPDFLKLFKNASTSYKKMKHVQKNLGVMQ
ncbi:hypothetical protein KKF84_16600 [Myxococcota bacterium]|nr:hypothetical protein [Myxococcota bacterium]MBU1536945.1 hypothetical protein [Myxococcota bacterium]